jgi:hypothetical protein
VVELLRPQQPAERLPHDVAGIVGKMRGDDPGVELVGLLQPQRKRLVELIERPVCPQLQRPFVREAEAQLNLRRRPAPRDDSVPRPWSPALPG